MTLTVSNLNRLLSFFCLLIVDINVIHSQCDLRPICPIVVFLLLVMFPLDALQITPNVVFIVHRMQFLPRLVALPHRK